NEHSTATEVVKGIHCSAPEFVTQFQVVPSNLPGKAINGLPVCIHAVARVGEGRRTKKRKGGTKTDGGQTEIPGIGDPGVQVEGGFGIAKYVAVGGKKAVAVTIPTEAGLIHFARGKRTD